MTIGIGTILVHPRHGVTSVVGLRSRVVRGKSVDYVDLKCDANQLLISVPRDNLDVVGLRPPLNAEEVAAVFGVLSAETESEPSNWSRRFKATEEKLRSGVLIRIAEAARDLVRRRVMSGISAGEKKLHDQSLALVAGELSLALGITHDDALAQMEERIHMVVV